MSPTEPHPPQHEDKASVASAAAKAAPSPPRVLPPGPAPHPPRPGISADSTNAVADAVLLRMEAMQKKLLAQLNASQANSLKAMREDMRKETKRIEATTQAQV